MFLIDDCTIIILYFEDGDHHVGDLKLLKMNTECIFYRYMEGYLMWRYILLIV